VFSWVKAHVGIMGNELAYQIAKAAVRDKETTITYNRIPKSTIYKEIEDEIITKWQKAWEESPKAVPTKQFFPSVPDIIKAKMHEPLTLQPWLPDTAKPEPTCTGLNY
jgi:hypothetical protein